MDTALNHGGACALVGSATLEADPVGRFVARALALLGSDEKLTSFAQRGWGGDI